MKPVLTYLVFFIIAFIILLSSQCKKPKNEVQLPPETQTGANVIGFKADGKIYVAKYAKVNGYYSLLNFPYPGDNGYFLTIGAHVNNESWFIAILGDSLQIHQGEMYSLNNNIDVAGKVSAVFINGSVEFFTKPFLTGELHISKLDSINKIISGTFWFDAIDTLFNTTVQIREGRFDMQYTE